MLDTKLDFEKSGKFCQESRIKGKKRYFLPESSNVDPMSCRNASDFWYADGRTLIEHSDEILKWQKVNYFNKKQLAWNKSRKWSERSFLS